MKTMMLYKSMLATAIIAVFICGCSSSKWEDQLNRLGHKQQQLLASYRGGEIPEDEYLSLVQEVNQSGQKIVTEHKEEVFQSQIEALKESAAPSHIIEYLSEASPSAQWEVEPFWSESHWGYELFHMSPRWMTSLILARQLPMGEYEIFSEDFESIHLLDLSGTACETATLVNNTIYVVTFQKGNYCWTPVKVQQYERK